MSYHHHLYQSQCHKNPKSVPTELGDVSPKGFALQVWQSSGRGVVAACKFSDQLRVILQRLDQLYQPNT